MEGCVDEACGFKRASAIKTIKDGRRLDRYRAPLKSLTVPLAVVVVEEYIFELWARCLVWARRSTWLA